MKKLMLVIGAFLLCAGSLGAQGPMATLEAETTYMMDLWIHGGEAWSLGASASVGLGFLDQDGQRVTKGLISSGIGTLQESIQLNVALDSAQLGQGVHSLKLHLKLVGAQGILGFSLASDYWLLPLNSGDVWLERESEGKVAIPDGKWCLLEDGERVFYAGEEVLLPKAELQVLGDRIQEVSQRDLWWESSFLNLKAGDEGEIKLNLQGPSEGGELTLGSNEYLELEWGLESLYIPPLPPGIHEIALSVLALLPPQGVQGEIWASWQGQEARLKVPIDRKWFEYGGIQEIQVDTDAPLLLPNGRVTRPNGMATVSVENKGLNVIVPMGNPKEVIWVGLPLAESVLWSIKTPEEKDPEKDFVIPIFIWDEGLTWRLVAGSEPWFLDVTEDRTRFKGRFGAINVETSQGQVSVTSTPHGLHKQGGWHWLEDADVRKGVFSLGKWQWRLTIPRQSQQPPSLGVQYSGESLRLRVTQKNAELRFSYDTWAWGGGLAPKNLWNLWVETVSPHIRLEADSQGVTFQYRSEHLQKVKLHLDPEKNLEALLKFDPWEAIFRIKPQGCAEIGLRYQGVTSRGSLLSVTKGAVQVKNQVVLAEVQGQLGYVLSPNCTIYAEGALGATMGRQGVLQSHFRYGGGLIFKPLPQLLASVGWNNHQGWQFKAGLVIPFVGRKTESNFE